MSDTTALVVYGVAVALLLLVASYRRQTANAVLFAVAAITLLVVLVLSGPWR